MLNNTQYNLLMSQIYLSLNDTNSISPDQLTQYKNMIADMEEFKSKPEDAKTYLLNLVGSYVDKASKTMPIETLLQHCTNILSTINANLAPINITYYLKTYENMLCDQFTPIADRIAILKECIVASNTESLDVKIDCRTSLLDIYLSNPSEYIDDIRVLSAEIKSLLALREAN